MLWYTRSKRLPHLTDILSVDRGVNDNLKINQETELLPVLGIVENQLNAKKDDAKKSEKVSAQSVQENHHSDLMTLLADEMNVAADEIYDFELCVVASTPYSTIQRSTDMHATHSGPSTTLSLPF